MNCQKGPPVKKLAKKDHLPVAARTRRRHVYMPYTCRLRVHAATGRRYFLANFCTRVLSSNSLAHVVLDVKNSNITADELRLHSFVPERRYILLIKFFLYILLNQIVSRLFHIQEIPKAV
jgi:hypothetical protein